MHSFIFKRRILFHRKSEVWRGEENWSTTLHHPPSAMFTPIFCIPISCIAFCGIQRSNWIIKNKPVLIWGLYVIHYVGIDVLPWPTVSITYPEDEGSRFLRNVGAKVKFDLEQAMKAQSGSRNIAFFNLDCGWSTRRPLLRLEERLRNVGAYFETHKAPKPPPPPQKKKKERGSSYVISAICRRVNEFCAILDFTPPRAVVS
jgi:hypothetical protein